MHVVIAPGRLKDGVTEEEMLAASDRFQREFVVHHPGVDSRYADIVFFADEAAIAEVMAAEQDSEVCHQFMAMWDDAEVAMWRVLQLHE
jgi:hypothetical protein